MVIFDFLHNAKSQVQINVPDHRFLETGVQADAGSAPLGAGAAGEGQELLRNAHSGKGPADTQLVEVCGLAVRRVWPPHPVLPL